MRAWAAVNIISPPLPDGVKGICCSPGQWRPHFYMWTAVNTPEWHTTKVGCAAALSLLNGTLAFSFTRVSRTHTSQVFAPKMCGTVCEDFFCSTTSQTEEIRKWTSEWMRERWRSGWQDREEHIIFHRKTIYILSPYYVNFEWPLQIILLDRELTHVSQRWNIISPWNTHLLTSTATWQKTRAKGRWVWVVFVWGERGCVYTEKLI